MTVKELIEELQKFPPDLPVTINEMETGWSRHVHAVDERGDCVEISYTERFTK